MVFSNGYAWATSSGDWNRELSIADAANWAYGSDKLSSPTGELKYYYNDALIYTSEMSPTDLYPYCTASNQTTEIDINANYNTSKRIDFTCTELPSNIGAMGMGLNSVNTVTDWHKFSAQFALDSTGGGSINQYKIRENNVDKTSYVTFSPSNGDVFSLRWAAVAAQTARLPPPPIVLGGL